MPAFLRKLFDLLSPRDQVRLYLLLGLLVLLALVETAGIASILPFMAVVTNPEVIHTNEWLSRLYAAMNFTSDQTFLVFLGFVVLAMLVLSNSLKAIYTWYTLYYHNRLLYSLSRQLLAKYMARPYSYYLNHNTAEMGKNVLEEVRQVITGLIDPATRVISSGLVSIAIITLLVIINPIVAVVIATVFGGAYGSIYFFSSKKLARIGAEQVAAGFEKFKSASEALSGIKEIKILGRESTFIKRFAAPAKHHARNNVSGGMIAQMPRYVLEVVAFGGIIMVALYFLMAGQGAEQMIPILALYAFAGYRLMPALQEVFANMASFRLRIASLDVLHRDLGPVSEASAWEQKLLDYRARDPIPFQKVIELQDISFWYAGASKPTIRSLNLKIEVNTSIGLVGATGSGKTTIVDIILGLLSPTSGQILVDGIPITDETLPAWQKNLGYVPQHIYIIDDTVTRNIAFGIPDDEIDMEAVRSAARIANLADFIENELKDGYNTMIGERGLRLSGGQRQRIGIARAMYCDPAILVMDEATSALDGITEEIVMDAVRTLSKRKTVILIAHRLTTVKECDVIYQLEDGAIVLRGSYENLMRESVWFRAAAGQR